MFQVKSALAFRAILISIFCACLLIVTALISWNFASENRKRHILKFLHLYRSTTMPVPKTSPAWRAQYDINCKMANSSHAQLVFMGDSITRGMIDSFDLIGRRWNRYEPLLLGIGGDGTQHLLWRIQHGESGPVQPKLVVLLIGTNNLGSARRDSGVVQVNEANNQQEPHRRSLVSARSDSDVVQGIIAVVQELRQRFPRSKVLVLGLLPRSDYNDVEGKRRIAWVNEELRKGVAGSQNVFYLDAGGSLLNPDGSLNKVALRDHVHPSRAGYEMFFSAIQPSVDRLLRE